VIGFGIDMKLVRGIQMCLTETCSRFEKGKIFIAYFLLKWSETYKYIIVIAFKLSIKLSS